MKASFKKWITTSLSRIRDGVLAEGEIRVMRHRIGRTLSNPKAPQDERDAVCSLLDAVQYYTPSVTADQARKGAEWLYGKCFRANGAVRNTAFVSENFRDHDLQVIRSLRDSPCFELVDFDDVGRSGWHVLVPIYRAYGANGLSFDYAVQSWQSGGASFIVEHA